MNTEFSKTLNEIGIKAKAASAILNTASSDQKNKFFDFAIDAIRENSDTILTANQADIEAARRNKKDEAFIDRLALDKNRLKEIRDTLVEIKSFQDPVGRVLASWDRPNGLNISRVSTPLGVIGLIFESRPNVAADAGGLCLKSGNAVISCDKGSMKVRKPNVKGIMMAKRAQVNVVSAQAPASSVTIVSQSPPPAKPAGKKYEGGSSAEEVARLLRDEANVI